MTSSRRLNRPSHKRMLWIVVALPLLALVAASLSVWLQIRQEALDSRLIQAIKDRQTDKAIFLLNQGASANAQGAAYRPMTVRTLLADLWARLHGQKPPNEQGISALLVACGLRYSSNHSRVWNDAPADRDIMHALLSHKADPNAWNEDDHVTPLETQVVRGDINPRFAHFAGEIPELVANFAYTSAEYPSNSNILC